MKRRHADASYYKQVLHVVILLAACLAVLRLDDAMLRVLAYTYRSRGMRLLRRWILLARHCYAVAITLVLSYCSVHQPLVINHNWPSVSDSSLIAPGMAELSNYRPMYQIDFYQD